uniref:Cytochrome c oxidase subunit Vb n=1 Tax=Dimocarpus longan TaxID=128017 RepID=G8E4C1_9ROSI|nr:cytochrome c oxidase subunit Vb [Dimocarpus longan]
MWRRICSSHLKALALSHSRSASSIAVSAAANRSLASPPLFTARLLSSDSGTSVKKKVEDVMPIATGHEREELAAELEGRKLLDIDFPVGPFGTKEAPAVVKSYYDKRIVGCPGGEGEDEHDVVWFWLEKGKPHECPVCSQ